MLVFIDNLIKSSLQNVKMWYMLVQKTLVLYLLCERLTIFSQDNEHNVPVIIFYRTVSKKQKQKPQKL